MTVTMFERIANKLSYFAIYEHSIIDAIQSAVDNGFTGVQLPVELPHFRLDSLTGRDIAAIRSAKDKQNIRLVLHAHDHTASLWEGNRSLRAGIREYYRALLDLAHAVDAQLVTIHLGQRPQYGTHTEPRLLLPAVDQDQCAATFSENLDFLISISAGRSVLCVENYQMDVSTTGLLQPYLDDHAVSLCWDLAKTYDRSMNLDTALEDYFWRNARHVKQVHLHDRAPGGHSHLTIGDGAFDFGRYLPRLAEYDVLDYCIEVRPVEKARESLARLREMLR